MIDTDRQVDAVKETSPALLAQALPTPGALLTPPLHTQDVVPVFAPRLLFIVMSRRVWLS